MNYNINTRLTFYNIVGIIDYKYINTNIKYLNHQ